MKKILIPILLLVVLVGVVIAADRHEWPKTTNTGSLGSAGLIWGELFVKNATVSGLTTRTGGLIKKTGAHTTDATLTSADCGSTQFMAAAGLDLTLPAVTAGCEFTFIVSAAVGTTNMTVKTPALADLIYGTLSVNNADVACSAEDIMTWVIDGETPGDFFSIISNGTYWYITGSDVETAAKLTCSAT